MFSLESLSFRVQSVRNLVRKFAIRYSSSILYSLLSYAWSLASQVQSRSSFLHPCIRVIYHFTLAMLKSRCKNGYNKHHSGEESSAVRTRDSLWHFLNPTLTMRFHLLRLLYLRGRSHEYIHDIYIRARRIHIAKVPSHRRAKNHEETRGIFPGEAGSKSNCPMIQRSCVLFLLWTADSVRPREEVIILYESSRTSSVGDEKWRIKRKLWRRERDWGRNWSGRRRKGGRERTMWKGKK